MPKSFFSNLPPNVNITETDLVKLIPLAQQVLDDPLLMNQLCDRVYELMLEDLSQQSERLRSYRRFI